MSTSSPFDELRIPRELACEFFAVFSRFEFSLKERGFCYVNRYGRAAPDWDRFAREMGGPLETQVSSGLAEAIAYLNAEPPQMQTSARGWSAVPLRGSSAGSRAIDAAQRVRHNLFHGGKYTPHSAQGRDEKLVRLALTLLNECLALDNQLRQAFDQHAF